MKNFLKKTILLFTLAGIVFLGGGVGVARATSHIANSTTAPAAASATTPMAAAESPSILTGVDQSTIEANRVLGIIKCGNWYSMMDPTCWAPLLTYRLYQVVSLLLLLSGSIFDFMLTLSIDKVFILQPFVDDIWKIMRDFSSMMFIFILLYAGIRTMIFGDDWHKPVMMVVVIALLINFSLFFTKLVIDAGNILAVGVYSGMGVVKTSGSYRVGDVSVEERNISETLVQGFGPEKFLKLSSGNADLAPTVFIISGVVSGIAAWVFFKAAFMFMGRLLAFWFLMAFSPFAFILMATPKSFEGRFGFSFDKWISMLISQAFVAPIFLFFIYIIMFAIQGGKEGAGILSKLGNPSGAGFFFDVIFIPIVIAAMIIYALKKALGVAEGMSGEFGKIGANIGNKALGLGLGLASGGASLVGREVIGSRAAKVFGSDYFQNMAAKGGVVGRFVGRQGENLATQLSKSSFDVRGVGFVSKALKSEKIDAGKAQKGGYMADRKAAEKADAERAKRMELTDKGKESIGGEPRKENIKRKEEAEKTHERAEEAVNKSAPVKQMRERKEEAKEKEGKAVSMAGDASIKKLEAEKRKEAALNGPQKVKAIEELEEARVAEQKALDELRDARTEAEKTREIYDSSSEVKALEEATKTLNEIKRIVAEDKKVFDRKVIEENLNRREISGKASTFNRFYLTKGDQKDAIKKIRAGEGKDEAETRKFNEQMKKAMKEIETSEPKVEKVEGSVGDKK